ncbi:sigma 54-interacting transcriptional regulator [Candidatus Poribacteria bacterium]|nr:sigma 54-interacting transcriptional regulator [Candidatus Poribacteria bacterium]
MRVKFYFHYKTPFWEDKTIRRIGDNKTIYLNTRIIAATNRNLAQAVLDKTFREDLFFRINVIQLMIFLITLLRFHRY